MLLKALSLRRDLLEHRAELRPVDRQLDRPYVQCNWCRKGATGYAATGRGRAAPSCGEHGINGTYMKGI